MITNSLEAKTGAATGVPSGKGSNKEVLGERKSTGGDIRRWAQASPSRKAPETQSFEAGVPAEGHANGSDAPAVLEAKAEEWIVVSRRKRKRLESLDRRALIIWGVPYSTSVQAISTFFFHPFGKVKRGVMTLEWRVAASGQDSESDQERFVFATFRSSVEREAHYGIIRTMCTGRNWKVQRSRTYSTRLKHRNTDISTVKAAAGKQQERNFYVPLDVSDDPMIHVLSSDAQVRSDSADPQPLKLMNNWSRQRLGSLNVQGGLKEKIAELEKYLVRGRYDFVALQEVRRAKQLAVEGFRYYAKVNDGGEGGVGILVALHLDPFVTRLQSRHKNQLWLKVRGTAGHKDLYICSAYMPQESSPVIERNTAWDELQESVRLYKLKGKVILAGDMNARLGLPTTAKEATALGPYASGKVSANGRLMLKLLCTLNMISLAGYYKPPTREGWVTRIDPGTGATSQIDYLLVPQEDQYQKSAFSVDETSLDSDHHLLRAYISCPRKLPKRKKRRQIHRFKVEKLRERPINKPVGERECTPAEEYQKAVSLEFGKDWDPQRIAKDAGGEQACANVLKDFLGKMNKALENSVGSKTITKKFSRPWYDAEVKAAIQTRRDAFKVFKSSNTRQHWNKYSHLRRAARRLVRQKQKKEWEKLIQKIGDDRSKNPKRMWSNVKRVIGAGKSKTGSAAVQKADGSLAVSEVDRREAWADYMSKLGQPLQDSNFDPQFATDTEDLVSLYEAESARSAKGTMDGDFSEDELVAALGKLQYYKACSFDQVRNEALKEGGAELRTNLLKLFNWINSTEHVPAGWAQSLVVMLYKDGDSTDPGNYRGISLISCLGKLYLSMWTQRITEHIDPRLAEEQGGFRAKRSTVDQIFAFNEALLHQRRAGRTTHCFFIDFRKAFDTVWHQGLWRRLWEEGVQGKPWRILRSLYSDLQASVLVEGEPSRATPLLQGVRQGCPLSPILFSCYINDLVRRLKELGYGVPIGDRDLTGLLYADDIVLMADSADKLQEMIDEVAKFCSEWRLSLNAKKSKIMVVAPNSATNGSLEASSDDEPTYTFRGEPLEVVTEYKYLGVIITNKLLWDRHISMVVDKGKEALQKQRCLFAQRQLPMTVKRLVFTSMVRSMLEYASQVWYGNKQQVSQLESIQHAGCVWILRVNSKANTVALRTILGLPSLRSRRDMLRLFYVGILLSKPPSTWPRHCFDTQPSDINKVLGKSQNHWTTQFQRLLNVNDQLLNSYQTVQQHVNQLGGVLQDYSPPSCDMELITPVKDWRASVRQAMADQEVESFRCAAGSQPTLAVLACSTDSGLRKPVNLIRRSSDRANWIRCRLLSGTSSLNGMLNKITRGQRSKLCPVCGFSEETVTHFLRACRDPSFITARARHNMRMVHSFDQMSDIQQSAFILGCEVKLDSKNIAATPDEDLTSKKLVESLWDIRCAALDASTAMDLTEESNKNNTVRQGRPKRGVRGVEAHSNATLSN